MDIYFSDFFGVDEELISDYGAFNVSLISDLPLFIDPFLLFNSKKTEYQKLHKQIIDYLKFLRKKSRTEDLNKGGLQAWYLFQEVKQNWFGFSIGSNKGSGLGTDFAKALHENLHKIFHKFGDEEITKGSHLEKLCLIKEGVGKDSISDFTTNLIKDYLLEYTQEFTLKFIPKVLTSKFRVRRARFNYDTESWEEGTYILPKFKDDFVILTPKELLTKDDTWINKADLISDLERIPDAVPDEQLRFQINNYFHSQLTHEPDKEPTQKEKSSAAYATLQKFPQLIDYFIKYKEENGEQARSISDEKVTYSQQVYIANVQEFTEGLQKTKFYENLKHNSFAEAKEKILVLKHFIENQDGYKLFYDTKGNVIKSENDLQLLFMLACNSSIFDVNREPNNGRGPVDFAFSFGKKDKTLVEFKLAKSTKLKDNLLKQVEIYQAANETEMAFKVIVYFSVSEHQRVLKILNETNLAGKANIILIDAVKDNKPTGSKA